MLSVLRTNMDLFPFIWNIIWRNRISPRRTKCGNSKKNLPFLLYLTLLYTSTVSLFVIFILMFKEHIKFIYLSVVEKILSCCKIGNEVNKHRTPTYKTKLYSNIFKQQARFRLVMFHFNYVFFLVYELSVVWQSAVHQQLFCNIKPPRHRGVVHSLYI